MCGLKMFNLGIMKNLTMIAVMVAMSATLPACKTTGLGLQTPEANRAKQISVNNCRIGISYNRGHDAPGRLENIRAIKDVDKIMVNQINQDIGGWTRADLTISEPYHIRTNLYYNLEQNTVVCGYENWKKAQSSGFKRVLHIRWGRNNSVKPSLSNDINTSINSEKVVGDYKKPYIVILANDIVEHGGMPKFKVKSGDVLEIIRDKTCLDGYSVCFEVRNPETGEFGFVTETRMKARHHIVVDDEDAP